MIPLLNMLSNVYLSSNFAAFSPKLSFIDISLYYQYMHIKNIERMNGNAAELSSDNPDFLWLTVIYLRLFILFKIS